MHEPLGNIYQANSHRVCKELGLIPGTPETLSLLCYANAKLAAQPIN